MLHFRQRRSPLYLLRSADPFRLAVSGDQRLTIRDPARLDAAEASLFQDLESGLLFEVDRNADSLEVSLVRRRPRFDAEIEAATVIQGNTLVERFTFHCVPESASIDRVLVRLLGTGGPPYRWSVEGGEDDEPAARRLSGKERAAWGTERPGDVWEITFRQPQTAPFSFKAERTLPFRGPHEVNLVSLLEADRQQARVLVEVLDGQDIDVRNRRLTPIPASQAERHFGATVRAAFHYEPRHDLSAGTESRLSVVPSPRAAQPAAWIWKCRLDTQAASDGATLHRATYWIQNRGRAVIDFELPIGSQLRSVTLDGLSVAEDHVLVDHRDLRIALPSQLRFPTVALCFVTADPPLKIFGVRQPAWPVCKLPVLEQEWILWLAPNCDLLSLHGLAAPEVSPSNGRLLGSLGRVSLSPLLSSGVDARGQAEADHPPFQKSPDQPWGRQLPWKRLEPLTPRLVGWRAARWSAADGGIPTQVTILHRPSLKVGAWILFLLFAIVTYANRLKRPWRLMAAAGLTGAFSLAIPAAIASLGIAMLAGMACGGLGRLFHGRRSRPSPSATRTAQLPAGQVAGLLLAVTTLVAPVMRVAWAAEDDASQEQQAFSTDVAAGPALHQVLVPVDGQRSPIGDQVYLAEPFLRELYRRDLAASARPRDGMVTAATYHATLVRDTVAKRLIVQDLEARFDVIVFDATRAVSIALPRDQTGWNVAGATVDGRAVKLQWDDKQGAFTFPVDDPGRYRLTVIFQSRIDNVTDGIDLKIPCVNQTQLRLAVADGTDPFELPTVRGAIAYHRDRRSVVAELGPADRLVIERRSRLTRTSDTAELEISEMTWLRVRPGAVLMDAKWRVRPLRGRIREVRLHRSPRLRLMPFPKEGLVESVETVPGVPHELRLQLRRATSDAVTIEAEFLVRGAAGIGRLPLPRPRLLGGRVIDRRLAVSVDEGLEYREFNTQELQAIPIPEFSDAWGDASDEPSLAYAMPAGDVDWQLVTRPRKPKTVVALRHDLLLEPGRAQVAFQAELTTDIGYRFGYQLHVPESLEVDRLSLTAGSERCSARWARADATTVCVFLSEPLSGAATLSLRGSLTLPRQGRLPLPVIDLPGTEVHSSQYQIRRRFPLRVDVQTGAGFEPLPSAIGGGAVDPQTPLVAAFTVAGRAADASLTISTNLPHVSGCGVTSLRHEGGTWVADWDARVEVRGGEVGQIAVDVPGWWSGPYRVSPDAVLEIVDLPSLDLRRLVLRPSRPIRDGERLHIDGPIEQTADQQMRLPDIRPRTSGSWRRLVRLPKVEHGKYRSREHVWEMRGLRPTRASEIPDWIEPSDDEPLWLRVVGQRGLVVQNVAMPAEGTPEITLADVQIAPVGMNSPLCGLASFDLLPAGLRDCIVEIPADGHLIQVFLEGRTTTLARIDDHRWRLTLESGRLPQRIGVLFAPRIAEAESAVYHCQAPMLVAGDCPIAVRQTQWTLYGSIGEQASDARVGAVEHEWERMQQLAMILDRSRRAWDTLPAGVRTGWYGAWLRRLRASGERLERLSAEQADRIGMVREAQRTYPKTTQDVPHGRKTVSYDGVLRRAQKLLATHDPSADPSLPQVPAGTEPLAPDVTETPERWFPAIFAGVERATYWHFRGPQPTIRWQPATSSGRSIPAGWLPAGAVLLLTLVALLARHYVVRDDSLEQGQPSDDTMSPNAQTETS
ncbi:MAG: hypothetical protein ACC645_01975 [Pirellulales bacterium]